MKDLATELALALANNGTLRYSERALVVLFMVEHAATLAPVDAAAVLRVADLIDRGAHWVLEGRTRNA